MPRNVAIPTDLAKRAKVVTAEKDIPLTKWIASLIERALATEERRKAKR